MDRFLSLAEQKKLFGEDSDHSNMTNIYGGAFQIDARPDENPAGKWVDRTYRKLTGHELFPKYARGAGYVLSPSLCRYIAQGLPEHDSGKGDLPLLSWQVFGCSMGFLGHRHSPWVYLVDHPFHVLHCVTWLEHDSYTFAVYETVCICTLFLSTCTHHIRNYGWILHCTFISGLWR